MIAYPVCAWFLVVCSTLIYIFRSWTKYVLWSQVWTVIIYCIVRCSLVHIATRHVFNDVLFLAVSGIHVMFLRSWIGDRFKCYMFVDMDGVTRVTFQNKLFSMLYVQIFKFHMLCILFGFTIFCWHICFNCVSMFELFNRYVFAFICNKCWCQKVHIFINHQAAHGPQPFCIMQYMVFGLGSTCTESHYHFILKLSSWAFQNW